MQADTLNTEIDSRHMNSTTLNALRAYLDGHNVMTLATQGQQGPWASAVFYVFDAGCFYFLSAAHTRHCQNLRRDARVSAAIQEDYEDWKKIRGIQLEGRATIVTQQHVDDVIERYSKKFPVTGPDAPAEIAKALDKISWYVLQPSRLYFIDNSQGLGHRDEVDIAEL